MDIVCDLEVDVNGETRFFVDKVKFFSFFSSPVLLLPTCECRIFGLVGFLLLLLPLFGYVSELVRTDYFIGQIATS